jgi:hypothetical protein
LASEGLYIRFRRSFRSKKFDFGKGLSYTVKKAQNRL